MKETTMKKFKDFNAFELAQHARGVALARAQWGYDAPAARTQWGDSLQPSDADLDSSAFARGYADTDRWMGMEPFDDDMEARDLIGDMLGLGGDRGDYFQQLQQLDRELFRALLKFACRWETFVGRDADVEEVETEADKAFWLAAADASSSGHPRPLPPPRG
jgi:hypothetical protein